MAALQPTVSMFGGPGQLSFLDLPGELRNDFYDRILQGITAEEDPAHVQSSRQDSLNMYEALLLSGKQINNEIASLFSNIVDKLTFRFTSVSELCSFVDKYQKHPLLSKARYDLRWYKDQVPGSKEDLMGDGAITVLESAVNFDSEVMEVFFDKVFIYRDIKEPSKLAASRPFKWLPAFKVGDAFTCSTVGSRSTPCLKVSANATSSGTSLCSYTWLATSKDSAHSPSIQGYLSLNGRIADFDTSAAWLKPICADQRAEDCMARLRRKREMYHCDEDRILF